MPINPCSIRWYLFKLRDRHYIISRLREFLRFRPYLRNKPPLSFDFDAVLQTSLAEFQTYHRLKVTDGTLNEETWAAVGAEMTDVEFQLISTAHPTLEYLLRGETAKLSCPQSTNANCLVNCIVGATEIAGLFQVSPTVYPNGKRRMWHDGAHAVSPDNTKHHDVITIEALTGTVLRTNIQEKGLYIADVSLDKYPNLVVTYKDLSEVVVQKGNYLKKGTRIGTVRPSGPPQDRVNRAGLHITLVYRKNWDAYVKRRSGIGVPNGESHEGDEDWFVDPLGEQSPINCPGLDVMDRNRVPYLGIPPQTN